MQGFFRELMKRKVIQAAVVYLVVAWVLMQIVDVMFPALGLPDWTITLAAALLIIGFPVALVLSWAYDLSPGGLRRESEVSETEAPAEAEDARKSVAVLAFADMSPDKDQEYFSDGLTEELLNALAQMNDLRVSSRTSSFAFKKSTDSIRTVAEQLDVQFIVEGSVRKAGDRLRITAQLIDAAKDNHVWSQTYDRDLDDIFAIQDDIARKIAQALRVTLAPQSLPAQGTADVEAYQHFLRGRSYFNMQGQKKIKSAIAEYQRATEIDPDFSRAWAGLALAYSYLVLFFGGGEEGLAAADAASQKAIALDPESADGYTARIMIAGAKAEHAEADAAFEKAVELDAESFEAYYQYGRYKIKRGDLPRALELFRRAWNIDPYDFRTPILCVWLYRDQGDEEKATEAAHTGIRNAEIHIEQNPDSARAYILAAGALRHIGEIDKGRQYIESALRIDPHSEDTHYNAACFYAQNGETERALDCLEKGMHDPEWIENDTDLISLRGHPRYEELMRKRRAALP